LVYIFIYFYIFIKEKNIIKNKKYNIRYGISCLATLSTQHEYRLLYDIYVNIHYLHICYATVMICWVYIFLLPNKEKSKLTAIFFIILF